MRGDVYREPRGRGYVCCRRYLVVIPLVLFVHRHGSALQSAFAAPPLSSFIGNLPLNRFCEWIWYAAQSGVERVKGYVFKAYRQSNHRTFWVSRVKSEGPWRMHEVSHESAEFIRSTFKLWRRQRNLQTTLIYRQDYALHIINAYFKSAH